MPGYARPAERIRSQMARDAISAHQDSVFCTVICYIVATIAKHYFWSSVEMIPVLTKLKGLTHLKTDKPPGGVDRNDLAGITKAIEQSNVVKFVLVATQHSSKSFNFNRQPRSKYWSLNDQRAPLLTLMSSVLSTEIKKIIRRQEGLYSCPRSIIHIDLKQDSIFVLTNNHELARLTDTAFCLLCHPKQPYVVHQNGR
jgi:hypothetical protein